MIIFLWLLMIKCFIKIRNKCSSISNKDLKNKKSKIINFIKINLTHRIKKLKKNKEDINTTHFNTLYITGNMRFGNYFASLNNAIIFCEFLCCKRIIINNDFIKHKIFYKKYNITIESNHSFNYIEKDSININVNFFFSLQFY